MEAEVIEKLKKQRGYIFEPIEDDYLFDLIKDTVEATIEVYQAHEIERVPFRGETTEEKVCFSLLRMRNFFQAIRHDRDFILEYRKKIIDNDVLDKAIRESFPKINYFIKVITDDLENGTLVSRELLEKNQETTYCLLECYEELVKKI
jgi:hypothetical protein